ncbi:Uncharacterised protein [Vibrio cholerae]|nr:Uncharacterised protein [Vibrio cholerae]CSI72190.1 Uncharacterised protein [Vibrio cholerae]
MGGVYQCFGDVRVRRYRERVVETASSTSAF